MEYYLEIDEDKALKLREGLELLETLDRDAIKEFDLCLYGLTNDPSVLDAAREAIASDSEDEITENDVQLGEVAVAIPINSDAIWALTGSGIKLRKESFVYPGGEGEGPRSGYFFSAQYHPTVTMHSFSHMALASSDSYIDRFLQQVGGKGVVTTQIKKKVQRSQDATRPVPTIEAPDQATPPATATAVPKQTSLNDAAVNRLVDDFLG